LFIPDPDPGFGYLTHPGSRGQKGTGSRIRIRNTGFFSALDLRFDLDLFFVTRTVMRVKQQNILDEI
jgi:hypothetical protein